MKVIIRFWRIITVWFVFRAPAVLAFAVVCSPAAALGSVAASSPEIIAATSSPAIVFADSLSSPATELPSPATELPSDNSGVTPRIPSPEALKSLKADKDFSYLYAAPEDGSWWAHFWVWLGQQLSQVLRDGEGLDFWGVLLSRVLPWLIVLLAVVLVIMKLLGIDPDSFLRKKAVAREMPFGEKTVAHQDDLNDRLEEALAQRNFRLAIRLYYLDILRQLSGAGLIEWHPDKTNRQYFREIGSRELREPFGRLTRLFEYVWYGETSPGEKEFEAARAEFRALKDSIQSEPK